MVSNLSLPGKVTNTNGQISEIQPISEDTISCIFNVLKPTEILPLLPALTQKLRERVCSEIVIDYAKYGLDRDKFMKLEISPKIKRVALRYFDIDNNSLSGEEFFLRLINPPIPNNFLKIISKEPLSERVLSGALDQACKHHEITIVKMLTEHQSTHRAFSSSSGLSIACAMNYLDVVKLLIPIKQLSTMYIYKDKGCFEWAAYHGNIEILKLLFSKLTISEQMQDRTNRGDSISSIKYSIKRTFEDTFEVAYRTNQIKLIKFLLADKRAEPNADINSAIIHASENGNAELLKLLLTHKRADPAHWNSNALGVAARAGQTATAKLLLDDKRADPNKCEALSKAVSGGHVEIVKLLLADKRIHTIKYAKKYDYGYVIRMFEFNNRTSILSNRQLEILPLLLQDKRFDPSSNNNAAIISFCKSGKLEAISLLLEDKRVDPSLPNNEAIIALLGNWPNSRMIEYYPNYRINLLKLVNLLLQCKGVDPSAQDNAAIIEASESGYYELVKFLLQDPRIDPSAQKNSAIISSSKAGHTELVKLLLKDKRVDPSARNSYALHEAFRKNHPEVVNLLLQDKRVNPFVISKYSLRSEQRYHGKMVGLIRRAQNQRKNMDPKRAL